MSKSLADNPFITEAKDKNGDSWYHQIVLELKDKEIERLHSIIKEVREYIDKFIKANYEDIFNQEQKDYMIKILEILDKEKV